MPSKVKRDEPREFRATAKGVACAITAAEGSGEKLGTFTGNAYTGAAMRPEGWYGPIVIDLAGVQVPSQHRPVLRQHDHEQIAGHTTSVKVDAAGIQVEGVFSGEPQHVAKIAHPAKNGFQWQLSIGATPIRTEFLEAGEKTEVNGREFTGPLSISRETVLGEVSFVPLGADGETSASVSASKGRAAVNATAMLKAAKQFGNVRAAKFSDEDIEKMSEEEAKTELAKCMKGEEEKKTEAEEKEEEKKAEARIAQSIAAATQKGIEAGRKAQADEEKRCADIRARVAKHGVVNCEVEEGGKKGTVNLVAHAIAAGWTADQAELHAYRNARPSNVGGPHLHFSSTPEVSEAVLEAAVLDATGRHSLRLEDDSFYVEQTPDGKGQFRRVPLHLQQQTQSEFRSRYTDQVRQTAHTMFRGRITLKQSLHLAAQGAGLGSGRQFDLTGEHGVRDYMEAWAYSRAIRAEGASTISISNILANVMNKFSLQGYLFTEQAWREICAIRPVNDFKPTKSINLLGDVMYKKLGASGELDNATLGDQAFANQADPYGRLITIPWTHIVNDDLGVLQTVPQKIGQGAGLALNDVIWALWKAMTTASVKGDDGVDFFRTTYDVTAAAKRAGKAYLPNKLTGAGSALSAAALQAAKALFDNQVDPNGNPLGFDGLKPTLLFGPSNWQSAMSLLQASGIIYGGASAALAPNANIWQGFFNPVMSRYLENASYGNSLTAWWMLFNPIALAVIEVAFLNGVDTPSVLQAGPDYQFDKLGISIRGTMPFGANAQNFRGGVYNVGA